MSSARIVGIVFLVLVPGLPGTDASAADSRTGRFDRNLVTARVASPTVPAVPASKIRVSEGKLTVPIGLRNHELETLTATPPGPGPFPLAVISHGVPRSSKDRRKVRLRNLLPVAEGFARRGYRAVIFARRGFATSSGIRRSRNTCAPTTSSVASGSAWIPITSRPTTGRTSNSWPPKPIPSSASRLTASWSTC